jgi:hypothetical protein
VLFDSARANAQLGGDLFVAATLDQQFQNLLIAACNFDLIQVDHDCLFARRMEFAACGSGE